MWPVKECSITAGSGTFYDFFSFTLKPTIFFTMLNEFSKKIRLSTYQNVAEFKENFFFLSFPSYSKHVTLEIKITVEVT